MAGSNKNSVVACHIQASNMCMQEYALYYAVDDLKLVQWTSGTRVRSPSRLSKYCAESLGGGKDRYTRYIEALHDKHLQTMIRACPL